MSEFLMVLKSDRTMFDALPEADQHAQIARYNEWVGSLVEQGIFKNGMGLAGGHFTIKPDEHRSVDGPFTEAKEVLTGFFHIEAESFEAAIEVGKTSPALEFGETMMVFKVGGA